MDGAFAKIVDGLLSAVAKIFTIFGKIPILDVLLGSEFTSYVFSSYLRPHQLDQYALLTFRLTIKQCNEHM